MGIFGGAIVVLWTVLCPWQRVFDMASFVSLGVLSGIPTEFRWDGPNCMC